MAFKTISGGSGNFLKWETPGQTVEGRLQGIKPGKKFADSDKPSNLAVVMQTNGVGVTFGMPTKLQGAYDDGSVKIGDSLRVVYLGYARSKAGRSFKDFDIQVDDGSDGPGDTPAAPHAAQAAPPAAAAAPAPATFDAAGVAALKDRLLKAKGEKEGGELYGRLEAAMQGDANRLGNALSQLLSAVK